MGGLRARLAGFAVLLAALPALGYRAGAAPPPATKGEEQAEETYAVECTFANPGYAGPCTVSEKVSQKLSPRAACAEILACLNSAQCLRTYCNATTVRGGWTLLKAERRGGAAPPGPASPPASPAPTPGRS
jgi:hypothetical protein